jgi:hypothetical protein
MMPGGPVLGDAIIRLVPNAQYRLKNENLSELEWLTEGIERPTDDDILRTFEELKSEYANQEYRRLRANAYPSIGDQLDALFHAGVFPAEMASKIQAVKDAFPKVVE